MCSDTIPYRGLIGKMFKVCLPFGKADVTPSSALFRRRRTVDDYSLTSAELPSVCLRHELRPNVAQGRRQSMPVLGRLTERSGDPASGKAEATLQRRIFDLDFRQLGLQLGDRIQKAAGHQCGTFAANMSRVRQI